MLALEAGIPNCDSMNFGIKVIKAVTMAHSAVYDKLTKRNVMLLKILKAALGSSIKKTKSNKRRTPKCCPEWMGGKEQSRYHLVSGCLLKNSTGYIKL